MDIQPFYKDILKAWYCLQDKKEKDKGVYKNEILWGNDKVRYKGKMLYYTNWINVGIMYLPDIVVGDRFINITELSRKLKSPTNILKLHKLLVSIPDKWKSEVKKKNVCLNEKESCTFFTIKNKLKHIGILQTKEIYKMLSTHLEKASCIEYWEKTKKTKYNW